MSGRVLHHPPIAVDYWKVRDCAHVQFFFLSHMHSDHTEGLTPSWSQPIYCSPVTKILLLDKFKLNPQQVRGLALNESHCLQFATESNESLSVTLIDANHCPGAVMFLFEGYFGQILYTGDFRYSQSLNYEESFARVCSSAVNVLYLDNTFCSPRCDFPSREQTMAEILQIISCHPDHRIVIGLRKLGKEGLLVAIAKHFRVQIYVTEERMHRLELLEVPNVFTTTESETRIQVVDQGQINQRNMDFWNEEMPTLAIIPTALYLVLNLNNGLNRSDVFVVPYSDHSSFTELQEFVSIVGPRAVIPILTNVTDRLGRAIPERGEMSCFAEYLDKSPAPSFCPPSDFAMFKRDSFVKTRTSNRGKISQIRSSIMKRCKFKPLVHHKGVVYEHDFGDKEGQESEPRVVHDLTMENADNWTDEQKVENSNGVKKVEENRLIDFAETADIWRWKNAHTQLKLEKYFQRSKTKENTHSFNFSKSGFDLASPPIPLNEYEDVLKCREHSSQELLGQKAKENTDSFNFSKTSFDLATPLLLSDNCEGVVKCREHSSQKLLDIADKTVGSCSVTESMAVAHLPLGDTTLNYCQIEDDLVTMPCAESEGNVALEISHERLKLSDLILERLQPLFAEEAQNMFQNFLKAKNKN